MLKNQLIRITTVPISLKTLLKGQHHYMSHYYDVLGVSSSGKELRDVAKDEAIPVFSVEMTRTISPLKDLKSLWNLYQLFKREKPLIVHTHTPKAGTVGMLAACLARIPIRLHTIAGLPLLESKGTKRRLLDVVEKATYACATMIYPNSKGLYDIIQENHYTKSSKLKVIAQGSSNGINTNHFAPKLYNDEENRRLRAKLSIESNDFVFIFIGRLVKDKGINELIAAFKQLEPVNCKLLLVGIFEEKLDPLEFDTSNEIGINPNIITVGWQNDVRPFLAISNALVFPSYREGFPNVVMQAGAMGLPSIVTNINGCNEIIIESENGVIIPPKDEKALLESMRYFIQDRDAVDKMANKSRELIVSRYEQHIVWEALLKEYQRLEKEYEMKKNV